MDSVNSNIESDEEVTINNNSGVIEGGFPNMN